jgi:hypothetical protein
MMPCMGGTAITPERYFSVRVQRGPKTCPSVATPDRDLFHSGKVIVV